MMHASIHPTFTPPARKSFLSQPAHRFSAIPVLCSATYTAYSSSSSPLQHIKFINGHYTCELFPLSMLRRRPNGKFLDDNASSVSFRNGAGTITLEVALMPMHSLEYAALCVIAPVAWGVIVYWISGWIEKRVAASMPVKGPNGNPAERGDTCLLYT